jgi:hypothetical protein
LAVIWVIHVIRRRKPSRCHEPDSYRPLLLDELEGGGDGRIILAGG